jgi:hypothetical protein
MCHLPHLPPPYPYSLIIFLTSEGQVSCRRTCVAVNEELPYMPFPREHGMRTSRKPRATHATSGTSHHWHTPFSGVSSARNRFSSIVLWVPDVLLLFVMLGLQVIVRKIIRKIISGKSTMVVRDDASLFGWAVWPEQRICSFKARALCWCESRMDVRR